MCGRISVTISANPKVWETSFLKQVEQLFLQWPVQLEGNWGVVWSGGQGRVRAVAQIWGIKLGKWFQSHLPPPPQGKEMCQASQSGHWVQMLPAFEDLSQWRLKGWEPHWAVVQLKVHVTAHLRTSWPGALVSKGSEPFLVSSPDMELGANACVHETAQGINGLIMSRHLKTKQNRTSKDLGRPGVPFQKSANSVVKMSTLGSHFSFKITVQMAIKFL